MKTTIVPAQITSLEDTVTAKLSLTQIVLLVLPLFISAFIFALLPPTLHIKTYKLVLATVIASPIMLLAVRLRGQLILKWLSVLIAYYYRPRRYILTKNEPCKCDLFKTEINDVEVENRSNEPILVKRIVLAPAEYFTLDEYLSGRNVRYFTDSKGGLSAVIEAK